MTSLTSNTVVRSAVVGLATTGLLAVPAPAQAGGDDDDSEVRNGSCSRQADYRMRLSEVDDDRLRAVFRIDSDKSNRRWTVRIFRAGDLVDREVERTNRFGNLRVADRFRGDDDQRVRVVARSGYGETCKRTMRLDD